MCILCVIQKWSRRVATMLPWLVIPMIGLWALSQLLPPAFRFEITSPRLACVFVLLITLFWYEILMPQLSSWRVRRNARMRERKRFEAIEMQKLRKTATRRCRNCLTPYRDQNPCGGRFMCSYCGHVSKRPVLDLPVPPGLSNSGILKDLVGKGGKMLNGKVWSDNSWIYGQDWLENGNWVSGPLTGNSGFLRKDGSEFFGGDDQCMAERSYSCFGTVFFKILAFIFKGIGWIRRKITRGSSSGDDSSLDTEDGGMLVKRGENAGGYNESRGEKARRKAEEKRQARLERELLEEEERKQREEVARLVEERRKLRDEITIVEKDRCKSVSASKEKDRKKEAERKRQERRKEKDKGSSKSNSDVEEMDKRAGKESDRKRDFDRKSDTDRRENSRTSTDTAKNHSVDMMHGNKSGNANSYSRGNAGTRYLDRMKGTFLSSSKALSGGSFFGRGVNTSIARENKPNASIDPLYSSANVREFSAPARSSMNGEDKAISRPVFSEPQPTMAPKKSWGQLFTRSPANSPVTNSNVIGRPCAKSQGEVQNPPNKGQLSSGQLYDNPISFGLPSPFSIPNFSYPSASSCTVPPLTSEAMFPRIGQGHCDFFSEGPEIFEDPCYIPDPVSLLGPVSESLDDFQLDLGTGFARDSGMEKPSAIRNIFSPEVSRPSPIESPVSRARLFEEKQSNLNRLPSTPEAHDAHRMPMDNSFGGNQNGTWQMWNTSPLRQDGLGLVGGGSASWLLPPELNRLNQDELKLPMAQKTAASLFSKDNQGFSRTISPQKVFPGNGQNIGNFASPMPGSTGDPWLSRSLFGTMPGNDGHFSCNHVEESSQKEMIYGSPNSSANRHSFGFSPPNSWVNRNERPSTGESTGNSSSTKPHIGGLYSTPDVQSLWSYD